MAANYNSTTLPPGTPQYPSRQTEQAYERLREAVITLVLQPGQPLTEASLAAWLGMGRTPVREALLKLRDEGLIDSVPRKGYYVSRLSAEDAQAIYEMLEGLEGMAAKLAAERATHEEIDRLEEAVRQQEEALDRDDLDAWSLADEAAHRILLEIADNPMIKRAVESLNARIKRLRLFTLRIRPKPTKSTSYHRAELEAIRAGNGPLARELRQEHWSHARAERVELLRRYIGANGAF